MRSTDRPMMWSDPPSGAGTAQARFHLPAGTVTFLMSDIEGSTRLWSASPETMGSAVEQVYEIIDRAVTQYDERFARGAGRRGQCRGGVPPGVGCARGRFAGAAGVARIFVAGSIDGFGRAAHGGCSGCGTRATTSGSRCLGALGCERSRAAVDVALARDPRSGRRSTARRGRAPRIPGTSPAARSWSG